MENKKTINEVLGRGVQKKAYLKHLFSIGLITVSVLIGMNVSLASESLGQMSQKHQELTLELCRLEKRIAAEKLRQFGEAQITLSSEDLERLKFKRDKKECLGE